MPPKETIREAARDIPVFRRCDVLVVGGGNSGCDLASEAARVSRSAHISMRRGYWFMPKTMFGVPTVEAIRPWMPGWLQRLVLRFCISVIVGDYQKYGLQKPAHKIFEAHPSVNSDLLSHFRHGRLTAHPDVKRLDGHEVEFADGRRGSFDLIVYATGHHVSFPFEPLSRDSKREIERLLRELGE